MKHLLIIISLLLLSSFLTSCDKKEETLYRWKNPSGDGYIWKGFGDKDTHQIYQGQVKDGEPNGQGTFTYPLTGVKYVGEFKDGKNMVKEHGHTLMEQIMLENLRMGYLMVKEHSLGYIKVSLTEKSLENGRMVLFGTEQHTTKTEKSKTSG